MSLRTSCFSSLFLIATGCSTMVASQKGDEFSWLEDLESNRAISWVKIQNEKSLGKLVNESFSKKYKKSVQDTVETEPTPEVRSSGAHLYSILHPEAGSLGVWKRSTLEKVKNPIRSWETVLDLDELSKKEKRRWVLKEVHFLPGTDLCLLGLSDGGGDKIEIREFDLKKKIFPADGFRFSEQKLWIEWVDKNHVAVSKAYGPKGTTKAGYGNQMRIFKRGSSTPTSALLEVPDHFLSIVLEGHQTVDGIKTIGYRYNSLDDTTLHLVEADVVKDLPFPPGTTVNGFSGDYFVVTLRRDWEIKSTKYTNGSVLAVSLDDAFNVNKVVPIFKPSESSAVGSVVVTKDYITLISIESVVSKITAFERGSRGFSSKPINLGSQYDHQVSLDVSYLDNILFLKSEGFLSPAALIAYDLKRNVSVPLKMQKKSFDQSDMMVTQSWATSKDGEKIPYFIVGKRKAIQKGNAPTIMTAYGGFQYLLLPKYDVVLGQQWLERGGVYVSANIRGGGEFGPSWHKVAQKEGRQKSFDDFIAVGESLISSGLTSSSSLGIYGGSNGGYLVGAVMNQRPELFGGVMAAVPLFDMLRFSKLLAGSAWIDEYGDPDKNKDFNFLSKLSPYHNIKFGVNYPPVFIYTSSSDDRVHPGHARKMVAKLQSDPIKKVFYFEHSEGGHSGSATLDQRIFWRSLQYEFFEQVLTKRN